MTRIIQIGRPVFLVQKGDKSTNGIMFASITNYCLAFLSINIELTVIDLLTDSKKRLIAFTIFTDRGRYTFFSTLTYFHWKSAVAILILHPFNLFIFQLRITIFKLSKCVKADSRLYVNSLIFKPRIFENLRDTLSLKFWCGFYGYGP